MIVLFTAYLQQKSLIDNQSQNHFDYELGDRNFKKAINKAINRLILGERVF
jgi:hypothetical protein